MFLVHFPQGAKAFPARALTAVPLVYQGLLKPLTCKEALYMGISKQIMRTKNTTVEERDLMHQYASAKLFGDGTPPVGTPALLIPKVDGMYQAERSHYRNHHPIRGRRMAAA